MEYNSKKIAYYKQLINEKGIDYLILGPYLLI